MNVSFFLSSCPPVSLSLSVCLSQSKADGDLDYKQLAALPRVKAVYDIQRPDIIPYQADQANTHLSDDTLERYSCGQVHTDTVMTVTALGEGSCDINKSFIERNSQFWWQQS